jgi:hypothetical protein
MMELSLLKVCEREITLVKSVISLSHTFYSDCPIIEVVT